jgi:hypothetical protein
MVQKVLRQLLVMVNELSSTIFPFFCALISSLDYSKEINDKIMSLGFEDCKVYISNVDCQTSAEGGIMVQVIGELSNRGGRWRKFVQTFFLAEQHAGFFVLNDVRRFIKDENDEEDEEEEEEVVKEASTNSAPISNDSTAEIAPPPAMTNGDHHEVEAAIEYVAKVEAVVEKKVDIIPTVVKEESRIVDEAPAVVEAPIPSPSPATPIVTATPVAAPSPVIAVPTPKSIPVEVVAIPEFIPEPAPVASSSKLPEPVVSSPSPSVTVPIVSPPTAPVEPPTPKSKPVSAAPISTPAASPPPAPVPAAVVAPVNLTPKSWADLAAANSVKWGSKAVNAKGVISATAPLSSPAPIASTSTSTAHPTASSSSSSARAFSPAVAAITSPCCFVKGVTESITASSLRDLLANRFGPLREFDVNRNKACAFLEFEKVESARRAIQASLRVSEGGEGGLMIGEGGEIVHVLVRKPAVTGGVKSGPGGGGNRTNGAGVRTNSAGGGGGGGKSVNVGTPLATVSASSASVVSAITTTSTATSEDLVVVVGKKKKNKKSANASNGNNVGPSSAASK